MRFAADAMLGKLAVWLRVLGHDTWYKKDVPDEELVSLARGEGRLILTRDTRLVRALGPEEYFFITHDAPLMQLKEAALGLRLGLDEGRLFSICTRCNEPLAGADRESVLGLVPEYVYMKVPAFKRCPACGRVYWHGTHHGRALARLMRLGLTTGRGDA